MRKAQGALEYLIIIAAVLAIAAIVVLFITGAFKGASGGGDIAKCRLTAATCANNIATGGATVAGCRPTCITSCADASGDDVLNTSIVVSLTNCVGRLTTTAFGCAYCAEGNTTLITK